MSYGSLQNQLPTREAIGACAQFQPVTITVNVNNWSGSGSGPFTQTIVVSGVTSDMGNLMLNMVNISNATSRQQYETAYSCLAANFTTNNGSITLTAWTKPAITFQAVLRGVTP